jgi:hypothetical protein
MNRLWYHELTSKIVNAGAGVGQTSVAHPFATLHTESPETASDLQ